MQNSHPLRTLALGLIKTYQVIVSPLLGSGKCRFHPTCSQYAIQAYQQHSWYYATYLTFTRIMRCNPFCSCGVDPVPRKFKQRIVKK